MANHFIKISKQTATTYRVSEIPRITNNPHFLSMLATFNCTLGKIEDLNPEVKFIAFSLDIPPENEKDVKEWLYANATTLSPTPPKDSTELQSENWDEMFALVSEKPETTIPGFPFSVPFPRMYGGQQYDIITAGGRIFRAEVNDSREWMQEGLEWRTLGKNRDGNKEKAFVAAWKLRPRIPKTNA